MFGSRLSASARMAPTRPCPLLICTVAGVSVSSAFISSSLTESALDHRQFLIGAALQRFRRGEARGAPGCVNWRPWRLPFRGARGC